MFGKMMNNFYYGKSGKGDFNKEDLPSNRFQLFWEMLRVRFSGLFRLNLIAVLAFVPLIFVIVTSVSTFLSGISMQMQLADIVSQAGVTLAGDTEEALAAFKQAGTDALIAAERTEEEAALWASLCTPDLLRTFIYQLISNLALFAIPCILITGPVEAGLAYVTRNWARDEHAFVWSDFKDAVKANWKQSLAISAITSVLPIILYVCWTFYGEQSQNSILFIIPQMLVLVLCLLWMLALVYMYFLIVTYKASLREIIKNGLLLGIGRLPQTVGVCLLHLLPFAIVAFLLLYTSIGYYAFMAIILYYILFGIAFARFINASVSNAVFDKYINSHIEGAKVNQGLRSDEDNYDIVTEEDEASKPE